MKKRNIKDSGDRLKCLEDLVGIFNSIQELLKKLPNFTCVNLLKITDITKSRLICGNFERTIKRQNQVRLFKQTFNQICQLLNHKKVRKSDVIMKFVMVSDALISRIKSQLCLQGLGLAGIIQGIQRTKESFILWGQSFKNGKNGSPTHFKNSDQYKLKYVFSKAEQSTANVSKQNSVSNFKGQYLCNVNKTFKKQLKEEKQTEKKNFSAESSILKSKRLDNSKRQKQNRNKFLAQHSKKKQIINPLKKNNAYNKTFAALDYKKRQINSSIKAQISDSKEQFGQADEQRNQQTVKNVDWKIQDISSQQVSIKEEQENKKSAYFQSQNYIRSKKNIEFALFGNKNKKNDCSGYHDEQSSCLNDSSQGNGQYGQYQRYKSRNCFTRRVIPFDNNYEKANKSDKAIPKTTTPKVSQIQKERKANQSRLNRSSNKNDFIMQDTTNPKKSKFPKFKDENKVQIYVENKIILNDKGQRSDLKDFYTELGQLRCEFIKPIDPYYQDKSMFFQQQNYLWQQEKRKMQKILQERKIKYCHQQFEMSLEVTNRRQQQACRMIRDDTFNQINRQFRDYKTISIEQV